MSHIVYTEEDIMLNADNMIDVSPMSEKGFIIVRAKDKKQIGFILSTKKEIKRVWPKKGLAQNAFFCHTDVVFNDQSIFEIVELP